MKWMFRLALLMVALLFAAFLILRTPDTDPAQMRAKYGGEASQFLQIDDDVTVHLRDEGPRNAPAIILLHGSNADLHTWKPWADGLKHRYRVIRFDQVGHGLTGADPAGDYGIDTYVADIDEVADALGLESFVLGGNSMGGSHAVAYTLAHPERVDALVLVDASGAPPLDESEERGGNIGFTIARMPVLNQLIKHITPRSMVEQSLRQSVSNQAVVTPQAVDRYWELLRYPGNRDATVARFSAERSRFDASEIARIDVPALVIWGEDDALIPVEAGLWYDRHLPDSRLVVYEDIGHLPHEEAADRSVAYLRQWLDAQDFASAAN